jgi:hypothetical protein
MPCRGENPLPGEPDRDEGRQRNGGEDIVVPHANRARELGPQQTQPDGLTQLGPEPYEVRLRAGSISRAKPIGKVDVGPQACGPS